MARKVILDVDPGIDDAMALAFALLHPGLEVVAVTAVGGNCSPADATRNVQAIVEAARSAALAAAGCRLGAGAGNRPAARRTRALRSRRSGRGRSARGRAAASLAVREGDLRPGPRRARRDYDRRPGTADEHRAGLSARSRIAVAGGPRRHRGRRGRRVRATTRPPPSSTSIAIRRPPRSSSARPPPRRSSRWT